MGAAAAHAIRGLPSGAFAFVMATGIVSTAFEIVGWDPLSIALLVVAIFGFGLLVVAFIWRLVSYPGNVMHDAQDPNRAFGFFTIVAAINVVGIRLYTPEAPTLTIVLALISVPLWLLLTYGVPGMLMLRTRNAPISHQIDGSWFLWVVGTQSLATVAAAIGKDMQSHVLSAIAVAMWGIGVLLYLMLSTLVTLRLLTVPSSPRTLGPAYWIYMGATAITVLAGSRIMLLSADLPIMRATGAVVSGFTYMLWAFGVWWVPLLVIFGVWRHVFHRVRMRYEAGLWSIVFPLGMYSVASMHFGVEAQLPLMYTMGEVGTWIAGVAWLLATVAMTRAGVLGWRRREALQTRDNDGLRT